MQIKSLKLKISIYLIFVITFTFCFSSKSEEDKLVAWWPMDEIEDGLIKDKSGNGNDAQIFGNVTLAEGKEGKSVFFDGKGRNCLVVHPAKNLDDLVAFSIEGWLKYADLFGLESEKDNYPTFFNRGNTQNYPAIWLFPGFHTQNKTSFERICAWMGTHHHRGYVSGVYSKALTWEKNRWYKIRVSVKPGFIQFFRDGINVGKGRLPMDYNMGRGNIYIGEYLKDKGFPMHGWLDEIKIYATPMSEKDYPPIITITTDQSDSTYKCGDTATFKISIKRKGNVIIGENIKYCLSLGGVQELLKGEEILKSQPLEIKGTLQYPGALRCTVIYNDTKKTYTSLGVAVFEPRKIEPVTKEPEDFIDFWNAKKKELAKIPLNPRITKSEKHSTKNVTVYKVRLGNINDSHVYGWLGVPVGKGPFPAILTLPYAGVYPLSGSATGEWIGWAQKDFIAMGISIHNCEPDLSAEAYKKLPQFSSGYYAFVGRNNRETSYFLRAFLGCIRAIDYLTSRPDWDKKNMIVTGSSQGGGLSIVTAGLDSRVTAMAANVPALCEHTGKFSGRPSGWPNLVSPKDTGVVANVSTYFDAVNFARHIQSPTLISVGFIDTTCPPMTVYSAFNVIPGEKQILPFPLMGHSQIKKYIEIRDKWIIKQVERRKN